MNRKTLEQLKEHLLKRLVDGEIDKAIYDQILSELESAYGDSGSSREEPTDWEAKINDWSRATGVICRSVIKNIQAGFQGVFSDPGEEGEKTKTPDSSPDTSNWDPKAKAAEKDREEQHLTLKEARLKRRLRILSILVLIYSINALFAGVLHLFGIWFPHPQPLFGLLSIALGGVMVYSGFCMREMKSYPFLWWSLFLFFLPLFWLWPLGIVVGAAGLILLSDRDAERFFSSVWDLDSPLFRSSGEKATKYKETSEEKRERKRLQKYS